MDTLAAIEKDIGRAMLADQHRLRGQVRAIRSAEKAGRPFDRRLARLSDEVARSVARSQARRAAVPAIRYDDQLPICAKREDIARAIRDHQVVVVCGETGSGKSTQLPKICLEIGRGIQGLIGHTQPRRIAARTVAARIAEELGSPLGQQVGYKIRFAESTSPQTLVKLMTDGILLAETQQDRFLNQYDTIILDEAHERSLNIDFLIGYLRQLLAKRGDLKLIVTSATIDAERFSRHFRFGGRPAPVIEVSGRMYPVEVRYRPLEPDEEGGEPDRDQAVLAAVDELAGLEPGDILVFMPTERDIHETAKVLRGRSLPGGGAAEILPLYARLSAKEQQRVFQPQTQRRIVIATNVAESSLTVPGVRYVIDPGTARISRYSPRSKTQRLPIERVSQASADQRKGRCGRVAPGVCIRLFSEEDYLARDRYTVPEIQRTNLASVILQVKALRLGDVESFPFLDPPKPEAIRDGYLTLFELGALDDQQNLTELGRRLSRLPVDPRIARMILAGYEEDCLHEILIIAAALEVQDPRERPLDKQEAADQCHGRFLDAESDFIAYLKLWDFYHQLKSELSGNQLRKACRQNFLSYNRMREWTDIRLQLLQLVQQAGMQQCPRRDEYGPIHRALLTGLLSSLAFRSGSYEYTAAGGGKFHLWPGSATFRRKPKWVVAAELLETNRRYLRCCARIDREWIEPAAAHLVRRVYSDLHWDRPSASAMAYEKVTLFGLPIVRRRRVHYGPVDPSTAREMLIKHGLVEGDLDMHADFLKHNDQLLKELERLQRKLRRNDLVRGPGARFDFYDRRIPPEVYDGRELGRWLRVVRRQDRRMLLMSREDLLRDSEPADAETQYPDAIAVDQVQLPLEYRFEPGAEDDGLSITVPVEALGQLDAQRLGWLVPGLLEHKVVALIKSLPKAIRRHLIPAPETARKVASQLRFGEGALLEAVAKQLSRFYGAPIPVEAFQQEKLPDELRMNIRVVGADGQVLARGRDVQQLRRQLGAQAAAGIAAIEDPQWNRDGIMAWDFDELPKSIAVRRGNLDLLAYPMLVDRGQSISLRLTASAERAAQQTRHALRRLLARAAPRELQAQVAWFPGLDVMALQSATIAGFNLRQQLVELLADRAMLADQPLPRTRAEYDQRLADGRERIVLAVQDAATIVPPLLEAYHQAELAVQRAESHQVRHAIDDVRGQLDQLIGPEFLTLTPWNWLQQFPRYFQAIRLRLEKLTGGSLPRDRQGCEEIHARWQAYKERLRQHEQVDRFDPELERFRWMLEEYRVSLFAQELGTAIPISAKRLDRQWERVAPP